MSNYREKGSYYDVPSDDMDLSVNLGEPTPSYNPKRYMEKQKEFARKTRDKLGQEEYKFSRYK